MKLLNRLPWLLHSPGSFRVLRGEYNTLKKSDFLAQLLKKGKMGTAK